MAATHPAETDALLHDHHKPNPAAFATYQREIYGQLRPPIFSTNPTAWEALAKKKVAHGNFFYVAGSAGLSRTCTANTDAFDRYRLRPHMMRDSTVRDTSIELFGKKYASPIILGPVGVHSIMHPDAEEATARAATNVGVPFVLSTAATRSIEEVAAASGSGDRWFQVRYCHSS
jgi:lactate 2-monooxygenase